MKKYIIIFLLLSQILNAQIVKLTAPSYSLQIGSPAIHAGTHIAGIPQYDIIGHPVDPVSPTMGAYEFFDYTNTYMINFENPSWNSNQLVGTNFILGHFQFISNHSLATNYGYAFDTKGISLYNLFKPGDSISIFSNGNFINLISMNVYQVSQTGIDSLLIEGWNGINKMYSRLYTNINQWQILQLNYNNINRFTFKSFNKVSTKSFDYNFDNIVYQDIPNPTPVTLTSFTGSVSGKTVILKWATATEVQNYGFNIERKKDGDVDYKMVGSFVPGHGNSNVPWKYSLIDIPGIGGWFYRLKQIDTDGNYVYYGKYLYVVLYRFMRAMINIAD